jgi:hypothetical protein
MFNFYRYRHLARKPDALALTITAFFFGLAVTATAQALV